MVDTVFDNHKITIDIQIYTLNISSGYIYISLLYNLYFSGY